MSAKRTLIGVVASFAAGAVLGVLFAPEKGSKTRKDISKKSKEFIDGVKEHINDLDESMTEDYEKAKEKASDAAGQTGKSKSK